MRLRLIVTALIASSLAACSSGGPVKRLSPPQASLNQLSVQADGQWQLDLRLQNFSTMSMRFEQVQLELHSGEQLIATLQAQPALVVGAESADIHRLTIQPTAQGRLLAAATLADARPLPYQLEGSVQAAPLDGRMRQYPIKFRSTLHPAPGLPGVLR